MLSNDFMFIDGERVELADEKNILDVIRKAGIELPTFCYYSELSIYGACRMCMVQDEWGGLMASCSTPPKKNMKVWTHTPKLQKHRKMILELLLASHCRDCTTCEKSGRCRLQELAIRFGIKRVRFDSMQTQCSLDESSPSIVRDNNKCILCGDCVRMCSEIQNVGAIDFARRGSKMKVTPAFDRPIAQTGCVNCGQCAAVCPTGAIVVKNETQELWNLLYDPTKRVVVQVAPAVRVALGEEFGIKSGENVMGKTVAALRKLGFDEIYDTSLAADLTVMEEASELQNRLNTGEKLPLFTSCCPAWVKYAENNYPEITPNISSCKSPMQMFASLIKEHYKNTETSDQRRTVMVSLMPCTAKKFEAGRSEFRSGGERDVDLVITTVEFAKMLRECGIVFNELEMEAPDMPFGIASGAGVLFGVTGGVTEAFIRRITEEKSSLALHNISFMGVRGMEGIKEALVPMGDRILKTAIVSGLANASALIEAIKEGSAEYDFVEVMACPGGCISGGGQPFSLQNGKIDRARGIYRADKLSGIKRSEENPMLLSLYNGVLKNKVAQILHVHYGK
ncbi:MAG: [FeFe] hydrogenase, group A [Eubacteriales bacterium]